MTQFRRLIVAFLITLALLGSTAAISSAPPVQFAGGGPGENGG